MNTELTIVKDLMSKHNLTKKDLFSFCICAVNFLEYFDEECMGDVMYNCIERYYGKDSNDTRAVAGALTAEKKHEHWTDEDQFIHYMICVQKRIPSAGGRDDLFGHFFTEFQRFERVYKREIMVPIILGCPVEKYDDTRFDDEDYIKSIISEDGMAIYKSYEERKNAEMEEYKRKEAAELAEEIEKRKSDEDFSVLLVACTDVTRLKGTFEEYNKKYYPDRDYKVIPLHKPQLMIIQTGGKNIEEVKEHILDVVKQRVMIMGHDSNDELLPIEKAFNVVPKELYDNKVTHVVAYL